MTSSEPSRITYFEISEKDLLNAPSLCLSLWKLKVLGDSTSTNPFELERPVEALVNDTYLDNLEEEINVAFLEKTDQDGDGMILINQTLLQSSLDECAPVYEPVLKAYRDAQNENPDAFRSLTFNWIRCWDIPKYGPPNRVFYPSREQIYATHPLNQTKIFKDEWRKRQAELYQSFLPDDPTIEEEFIAFDKSVDAASGGGVCVTNLVRPLRFISFRFVRR